MSNDPMLPQVPEAHPEDIEDVSWALSTAEAMWARGDHAEGIKWVRRAAEAASEAENDTRALELAKAAADLMNMLSRRNSGSTSIEVEEIDPMSEPAPPPVPPARPGMPPAGWPRVKRPSVPVPGPAGAVRPSRPPAPLPSKTSQPPPAIPRGKPLGTNTKPPSMHPASPKAAEKKKSRRSRDNLEVAAAPPPARLASDTADTATIDVPVIARARRPEDPTVASRVDDIVRQATREHDVDGWDSSATMNLTGEEYAYGAADRMTAVGVPPEVERELAARDATSRENTTVQIPIHSPLAPPPGGQVRGSGSNPPVTVTALAPQSATMMSSAPVSIAADVPPGARVSAPEPHDPGITTSQAVRVVVWRDGSGVHVAPAGTIVSAITVDAVLVALEPNADLTAWLSPKTR